MKKISLVLAVICAAMKVYAQQNMTLYNMQTIPQRNNLNPALQFEGTAMVGMPLLSGIYMNFSNSAFKLTDFVRRDTNDSLYLDGDHIISKMKDEHNFISTSTHLDILSFGFKMKKSYIGFSATEKINSQFDYPKEMMEFIWKGNAASLGKETNIQFGFNGIHYREYALNYSFIFKSKFSLGTKLKYLYGMENASSNQSKVTLYTDPNSFAITAKTDININTSGIEENTFDNFSLSEYAFGRKNTGFAMDVGAAYQLSQKVILSASVLDIGKIKWNSHVVNYKSNSEKSEITYYGIDLNQFVSGTSSNEVWQDLADTLTSTFKINHSQYAYETVLPVQFYIGSNYIINSKHSAGLLMHGQKIEKSVHMDYSLSFNKTFGRFFSAGVSTSVINQSYANFGLGLALKMGSSQVYFASDNVYGVIYPTRTQNANFRAGINFIFNKKPKPVKAADAPIENI